MNNLKWISFHQNNSGGYYIQNEDVSAFVCIQGKSVDQIKRKAESLFSGNDSYCECCGERWSTWAGEDNMMDEPYYYDKPLKDSFDTYCNGSYATLHFHNGEVRYVKKHEGDYVELLECPDDE